MSHEFPDAVRSEFYRILGARRDIRSFKSDAVPDDVLARILAAAHLAGSVGYMQPWNFIVVKDVEIRKAVHQHVDACRIAAAQSFPADLRGKYLNYKLEGILDAPLNICVTCDSSRHGPEVIGRNTIRESDVHSTCCAIQNLWLAARTEGVGVGWVSIMQPKFIAPLLGIPDHIQLVGYLCVGYTDEFPAKPALETTGWLKRLPLDQLVFGDGWKNPVAEPFAQELANSHKELIDG